MLRVTRERYQAGAWQAAPGRSKKTPAQSSHFLARRDSQKTWRPAPPSDRLDFPWFFRFGGRGTDRSLSENSSPKSTSPCH